MSVPGKEHVQEAESNARSVCVCARVHGPFTGLCMREQNGYPGPPSQAALCVQRGSDLLQVFLPHGNGIQSWRWGLSGTSELWIALSDTKSERYSQRTKGSDDSSGHEPDNLVSGHKQVISSSSKN